ncbi:unnamed protein product [Didymodactylos carnosus]|uniref:Integrase catalytic domain-containing protein n=1 Tax=Didymodactylos carnosus TaxID=1234261 RepID=A0A815QRL2_9BILA|nr:unnamed protein product [Didymodactylos carnosus]CAF4336204.1 unnamed protein product [Didymodactylos carnosus]
MTASSSITIQVNNGETPFYEELEKYINSLSEKFQKKSVFKEKVYDDIVKCLLLPKGKSSDLYSSKFIYWVKHNFVLMKIVDIDIVCCVKSKKPICIYEAFYNVISEGHVTVSHGGRHKTVSVLNSHYSWIPRFCVEIFLKHCIPCQTRKPIKQHIVSKPIISLGVMTRPQIDLIDMRTRPDTMVPDIVYNWILNCIDHFSKFSLAFPLKNKSADEVAMKLRELFFVFGPPRLLHSDNGREFIVNVITELKKLFPDLVFVRGRPRHPRSQGCIERANGVLCDALGKWMPTNNSSHWSEGLLPVMYGINTRISSVTKTTPYQVMFGQPPRLDSELLIFLRLLPLYQDMIICKAATNTDKFNLNDCVGVPTHTVDRTNTDAKYLPCLIVEKVEKDKTVVYKLACQYGKLENTFTIEHFVDLKSACPEELKQLAIDDLKDITMIEACKLYVRGWPYMRLEGKMCYETMCM